MTEHRLGRMRTAMMVCAAVVFLVGLIDSQAGTPIYSYVDERRNLVATDRLENIPERYRARVKVTESVASEKPSSGASSLFSTSGRGEGLLFWLIDHLPPTMIPGLSTYKSVMLIGGFLAMVLFYGAGKLTGSAFLRLLMPWAVGFLGLATLYFMFVSDLGDKVAARSAAKSDGSLIHQFQEKSKHIEGQKQERLQQFNQMSDETRP
ncbi:MAG: hypothetical protein ACREI2_02435 [Nitrospiraceae bacterium]